jgi:hypothetical protein
MKNRGAPDVAARMFPAIVVVAAVVAFGPPGPLVPHRAALQRAEALARDGALDQAEAVLRSEVDEAEPEAADLLTLHARMLGRLQALERTLPGLGRRFVPYVFAPPTSRLPSTLADLHRLLPHDPALQEAVGTPTGVVVEGGRRAAALLLRGAVVDAARQHGLALVSTPAEATLRLDFDLEEVDPRGTLLEGTAMHSYTGHFVVAVDRPGRVVVDNGVIVQLLGINPTRAIDANLDRVVDRVLTGVVVEWIRRSLQGTLAAEAPTP